MEDNAVYTRGSIGRTMVRTAAGMIAGTLAMTGYNLADAYFVGQLPGAEPMAAMGFTFPVVMLVTFLFRGLVVGVTTTTAQAIGRRRPDKATRLVAWGVVLAALFSAVLAVLGTLTAPWVFARVFGAEGETLAFTLAYMDIWYVGCVTASLSMLGNDLLIVVGRAKTASALMIAGMLANVVLDPMFIFGWGPVPAMGIEGAAVATVISQGLAMILVLGVLRHRYGLLRWTRLPWRRVRLIWIAIIRFGAPAAVGMLMIPLGSAVVTWVTAKFGVAAMAAAAGAARLEGLAFVVPAALGMTLVPMVGQNYGARLYSRIRECRRFASAFAFVYLLAVAAVFFVFADVLAARFSTDAEARRLMALYLRIIPWGLGMMEIHRFSSFYFTGCSRPAMSAWLNATRILGLMIPFTLLALWCRSLTGVYVARLASDVLSGAIGFWLAGRMVARLPADGVAEHLKLTGTDEAVAAAATSSSGRFLE